MRSMAPGSPLMPTTFALRPASASAAAREKSGFKPYATTSRFIVGDLVNHPKFGNGIVTKVLESSKVEILFAEGSRVLLHTDG